MGCGGGKQQQPAQQPQQQAVDLVPEPKAPQDLHSPDKKLEFLLSHEITQYLEKKSPNYEKLISKLLVEASIKKNEVPQYHQLLTTEISKNQHNDEKISQFIGVSKELLNNELTSFWGLQHNWDENDMKMQLIAFGLLIDLKHIRETIATKQQVWWNNEYFKEYFEKLQIHKEAVDQTAHEELRDVIAIKKALKAKIDIRVTELNEIERKQKLQEKKEKLIALNSLKDKVISEAGKDDQDAKIHYAKMQNQQYATPV